MAEADIQLHHAANQTVPGKLLLAPAPGEVTAVVFNPGEEDQKRPLERRVDEPIVEAGARDRWLVCAVRSALQVPAEL